MKKNHDIVEVACEVRRETEKAYLVFDGSEDANGKPIEQWVPKSQCEWDGKTMQMPEWLAKDKGLI